MARLSNLPSGCHLLNPLSAPSWSIKGFGEVLRFAHYFAILKLHYADGVERATLVGDRVFCNPQFARSEKPPNAEARRFVRVMAAEVLQIPFAVYAFTGLRVIADYMLVVDFMLDILISGRRSGPMLAQGGFDSFGCHALAALVFDLCHFRVLCPYCTHNYLVVFAFVIARALREGAARVH
jgi:hypothetical protein